MLHYTIVMPKPAIVISHWHHSAENLTTSALEFYQSIEMALRARQIDVQVERIDWNEGGILTAKRQYLRVSYQRFVFDISAFPFGREFYFGWWHGKKPVSFSAAAGCMAVLAFPLVYVMAVAALGVVTGTIGFLVLLFIAVMSLATQASGAASDFLEMLVSLPYVGRIFRVLFKPGTYYAEDTRIIFAETVERSVQEVIAGILTINNMSPLTPEQRAPKPVRAEF